MGVYKLVAVYVTYNEPASKKRYVFGGKTITLNDAFKKAMTFVDDIKNEKTTVNIKETLYAATLSNWREVPKASSTKGAQSYCDNGWPAAKLLKPRAIGSRL